MLNDLIARSLTVISAGGVGGGISGFLESLVQAQKMSAQQQAAARKKRLGFMGLKSLVGTNVGKNYEKQLGRAIFMYNFLSAVNNLYLVRYIVAAHARTGLPGVVFCLVGYGVFEKLVH